MNVRTERTATTTNTAVPFLGLVLFFCKFVSFLSLFSLFCLVRKEIMTTDRDELTEKKRRQQRRFGAHLTFNRFPAAKTVPL